MPITIRRLESSSEKAELCTRLAAELPMWFGRPASNALYARDMASRDCLVAEIDGDAAGLIALDFAVATTCNIWWLAVSPHVHRRGIGRALVTRALDGARGRRCRYAAVATMSPRAESPEYAQTRRFYSALGFEPFVEFEPEPGDVMMWMMRAL